MARKTSKDKDAPAWIAPHFQAAIDSQQRLMRAVAISRNGIGLIPTMPRLSRALARIKGGPEPDPARQKLVEEDAEFAQSEIRDDFPVLHALATVGLWSWLEHLVKGVAMAWIRHNKSSLSTPPLQRIRIRLSDYISLTRIEQAAYLVELLEQETSLSLKHGVNRFESLLEPFELSGPVSQDTAKNLFELQQVRNAIAHQNGRCDRRLKASCPWLKLRIGSPVSVGHDQLERYSRACMDYGLELLYRIGDHYGANLREDANDT